MNSRILLLIFVLISIIGIAYFMYKQNKLSEEIDAKLITYLTNQDDDCKKNTYMPYEMSVGDVGNTVQYNDTKHNNTIYNNNSSNDNIYYNKNNLGDHEVGDDEVSNHEVGNDEVSDPVVSDDEVSNPVVSDDHEVSNLVVSDHDISNFDESDHDENDHNESDHDDSDQDVTNDDVTKHNGGNYNMRDHDKDDVNIVDNNIGNYNDFNATNESKHYIDNNQLSSIKQIDITNYTQASNITFEKQGNKKETYKNPKSTKSLYNVNNLDTVNNIGNKDVKDNNIKIPIDLNEEMNDTESIMSTKLETQQIYNQSSLLKMTIPELKELANTNQIQFNKSIRKNDLINKIIHI